MPCAERVLWQALGADETTSAHQSVIDSASTVSSEVPALVKSVESDGDSEFGSITGSLDSGFYGSQASLTGLPLMRDNLSALAGTVSRSRNPSQATTRRGEGGREVPAGTTSTRNCEPRRTGARQHAAQARHPNAHPQAGGRTRNGGYCIHLGVVLQKIDLLLGRMNNIRSAEGSFSVSRGELYTFKEVA